MFPGHRRKQEEERDVLDDRRRQEWAGKITVPDVWGLQNLMISMA